MSYKNELIQKNKAKPGMRGKINAKCIECIYDELSKGTWKAQVEACTSPLCPLFDVRPTQKKEMESA